MTGDLSALAVHLVQEPSGPAKISEPEDGGGKMQLRKNAVCMKRQQKIRNKKPLKQWANK
jgi:hypothetical protein